MGLIGYFGKNRFEVSDRSALPLENFQRSAAARFETLERIGLKPLTEFIAPGLDTVSFTIKPNVVLGAKPRQTLDHWNQLANAGNPDVLVIGNKVLGTDKWVVKSASEAWENIDGQGRVLNGTINLTFEEYMTK